MRENEYIKPLRSTDQVVGYIVVETVPDDTFSVGGDRVVRAFGLHDSGRLLTEDSAEHMADVMRQDAEECDAAAVYTVVPVQGDYFDVVLPEDRLRAIDRGEVL